MKLLVPDRATPGRVTATDVDVPRAGPHECLVRVDAFGVNQGELRRLRNPPAGWVPGWDFAGRVVAVGRGVSCPLVGARVVGLADFAAGGAWAEYVASPPDMLANVPDEVSAAAAAALPVVGITAWRCLQHGGFLLGRRVLVTAATGAVGRVAVQLARLAGASVTASVRSRQRALALDVQADEVVEGTAWSGRFDLVLDAVGGDHLVAALACVAIHGTVVSLGQVAEEAAVLKGDWTAGGATLFKYRGAQDPPRTVTRELAFMLAQVRKGALNVGPLDIRHWRPGHGIPELQAQPSGAKTIVVIDNGDA